MRLLQFSLKWIFGLTSSIALFIGMTMYSQGSKPVAIIFVFYTPIVVGAILGAIQALTGKSVPRILTASAASAAVFSLLVGGIAIEDGQIHKFLDPTDEFLSPEVWLVFFLPLHVVSAIIVSLLFGLPLRCLLHYRRKNSEIGLRSTKEEKRTDMSSMEERIETLEKELQELKRRRPTNVDSST